MQMGVPPSRYLTEWDSEDKALINAFLNWRADLHTCGRPLSESLFDPDVPPEERPDYVIGVQTCSACQAQDKEAVDQAKKDKDLIEAGRNPSSWRLTTVYEIGELPEEQQAAIRAGRNQKPLRMPPSSPPPVKYASGPVD